MFQKRNIEIQPLSEKEDQWLYKYYHVGGGAWVYHEKEYEGECHTIDRNSSYPSHYDSSMLTPIGQPTFSTLKTSDLDRYYDTLKFDYGIYRATITNPNNTNYAKYFKLRCDNMYSHSDLLHAQDIGLKIDLIDDNEVNAMIYDKSVLVKSTKMFHEYVQYFYDLKKRDVKIAKDFLNVFSGAMSKQNKQYKRTSPTKIIEINNKDVFNMERRYDEHLVSYMPNNAHFKYALARHTIFCVNKMKIYLQKLVIKYESKVVRCHTDSLTFNCVDPISEFKIGKSLSQWKIEKDKCGTCKIQRGLIRYL